MSSKLNMFNLTTGVLEKILSGELIKSPILQILSWTLTEVDSKEPRYRFLLSDGRYYYQNCILAMTCFDSAQNMILDRFALIKLNRYAINTLGDKKILLMLEVELISPSSDAGKKIGNPIAWSKKTDFPAVHATTTIHAAKGQSNTKKNKAKRKNVRFEGDMIFKDFSFTQLLSIADLCPYLYINWTVRGRVMFKSPIRTWNNFRGNGRLFTFYLKDMSGEIKVTAFNHECDIFFDMIQIGKVYYLNKAQVKLSKRKFNPDLTHEYELALNSESRVRLGNDDDDDGCPQIEFDFIKIREIETCIANDVIDVVGVCRQVGNMIKINSKEQNRELKKRDISVVDDSEVEVTITLWNDHASSFNGEEGSSIVLKKARVSDFQGRTLTTSSRTMIQVDPNLTIANGLKGWYNRRRLDLQVAKLTLNNQKVLTEYTNLGSITKEKILTSAQKVLFTYTKAFVTQIGRVTIYLACPDGCKKKLIEMNDGFFRCDKCNKATNQAEKQMIINLAVTDATTSTWIIAFNLEAEKIIGMSTEQADELKKENYDKFQSTLNQLHFKSLVFKLRSKVNCFKEKAKIRSYVISTKSLDITNYSYKLLEKIKAIS